MGSPNYHVVHHWDSRARVLIHRHGEEKQILTVPELPFINGWVQDFLTLGRGLWRSA